MRCSSFSAILILELHWSIRSNSLQFLQERENLTCSENSLLTTYCAVTLCDTFEEQLEIVKLKTWQRQTSTLNVNENDVQDPLWYKHW